MAGIPEQGALRAVSRHTRFPVRAITPQIFDSAFDPLRETPSIIWNAVNATFEYDLLADKSPVAITTFEVAHRAGLPPEDSTAEMSTHRNDAVLCAAFAADVYIGIQIFVPTTRPVEYWPVAAILGLNGNPAHVAPVAIT